MTPVKGIDPRITTPEMQTAYLYMERLGALGARSWGSCGLWRPSRSAWGSSAGRPPLLHLYAVRGP